MCVRFKIFMVCSSTQTLQGFFDLSSPKECSPSNNSNQSPFFFFFLGITFNLHTQIPQLLEASLLRLCFRRTNIPRQCRNRFQSNIFGIGGYEM
jgi:hypothetical protein